MGVRDWLAEIDGTRALLLGERPDCRFGGSVHIPYFARAKILGELPVQRLTSAQNFKLFRIEPGFKQYAPQCWGGLHHCRCGAADQPDQAQRVHDVSTARDDELRAGRQWQEDFERGNIEAWCRHGEEDVGRTNAGRLLHRCQEVHDRAMFNIDALWPARRAGGVDTISEIGWVHPRQAGPWLLGEIQTNVLKVDANRNLLP